MKTYAMDAETGGFDDEVDLPVKAITIRQPWAWHIVNSGKNIENRSWSTTFRGPICIHAGANKNKRNFNRDRDDSVSMGGFSPTLDTIPMGGIVAIAEIVDCVSSHDSPWFFGPYGFILENVTPVTFIPVKGALGIFNWEKRVIQRDEGTMHCPACGGAAAKAPPQPCFCHQVRPPCPPCTDNVFVCPRCKTEWLGQQ